MKIKKKKNLTYFKSSLEVVLVRMEENVTESKCWDSYFWRGPRCFKGLLL